MEPGVQEHQAGR
uniref:Uncharacterized protein n=1 Tax=Arundo donax TaxID=35708 RepID=A0A0A9ACJ0_ARUDO